MKSQNHSEYQKEYRKHRVHRVVIFSQQEYNTLMDMARFYGKPFSTLVRELALIQASNQYLLPNETQTKAVQLLLTRIGTNINQIAHVSNATLHVSNNAIQSIKSQFTKLEKDIMNVYHKPILVEDVVRFAITKNPAYLKRIKTILSEFS